MPTLPPPTAFGLPPKFSQWRENQGEACEDILDMDTRFLVLVCPTGSGKSATYMTASQLVKGRTAILTSTKGLQTQLVEDFGQMAGVTDIRGRANYPCRLNSKVNCDSGICSFGAKCSLRDEGGCFYFDKLREAKRSKVVITNYAYWMSQNEYSDGLGAFEMLVLDEAHSAPDQVINHISSSFRKSSPVERKLLPDKAPTNANDWRGWARSAAADVEEQLELAVINRKEKKMAVLKRVHQKLARLYEGIDHSWVWEYGDNLSLSPIWPAPFAESTLFLGISKVVLTSATVVPKTADLLGVPEDSRFVEYPHSFPAAHRPLVHVPTVRMNYKIGELENRQWVNRVDQIIRDRLGTKGVIHTVSYARRDLVMAKSRYASHMITHNRRNAESVVRSFKHADAPCILVSPSMTTGYDFPGDQCRWQVVVKLPFPDTRGNITKARNNGDKDYVNYLVAQQLIQAVGRGTRNKEDWCETFVTDDSIQWWIEKNQHLLVEWFKGSYKVSRMVPGPLKGGGG